MIEEFGKYVNLLVYKTAVDGGLQEVMFQSVALTDDVGVPSTDRLRVDFEYKQWQGYGTSKVSIYNLNIETQTKLASLKGLTYRLLVGLHGEKPDQLGDTMRVSNVLTVKQVPDGITTLYGFTSNKVKFLEYYA